MKKITFILIAAFMAFGLNGWGQSRDSWTETFDDQHSSTYGTGTITISGRDWTRKDAGNFAYANTNMGSYAFTINDDKDDAQITTPPLNTCGTVTFEYAYKSGNSTNVFVLQKSLDGTTYIDLDTHTLGASSELNYVTYSFDVNDNSTIIYIRILSDHQNAHLFIDNYTVTNYSGTGPDNPTPFTATTYSTSQIDLAWVQNANTNDVMVAWSTSPTFGTPVDGTAYSASDPITGGGTVIYNGSAVLYNHTSLTAGTQYYYKAWSVDGSTDYSSGVTSDATTYKDEPTNHVTNFMAGPGTPTSSVIDLVWDDPETGVIPDGYLVKGSSISYADITAPVDDIPETDGGLVLNVASLVEYASFSNLNPSTTYFFKIWPYTNSGAAIDYKLDGTVPTADEETTAPPTQPNAWINEFHYDNSGSDVGEFVEIVLENPGSYALSDFQINLYNGSNGESYDSETVNNFTVGNTQGDFTFYYWDPSSIQNGPDGIAISYQGTLIIDQFLSYEGSFAATDGPANGVTSTDIGVSEPGTTPIGYSLQLKGGGDSYSLFSWQSPATSTKGVINNKQYLGNYTTWLGSADNVWATSGNWNNGIPGSSQNVIIPQGVTYYPTLSAAGTCNNIIIESNSSGNASILGNTNLTISGSATVERYFGAYTGDDNGWHYIGSPVDNMTIAASDFDPTGTANDLYSWDEVNYMWRSFQGGLFGSTTLENGMGYMVAYSSNVTNSYTGTLNAADVTHPNLSLTPAEGNGWHLLGNPFPSAIKWNDGNWTLTNVGGVAQVYDEAAGNTITIVADEIIPSTNGFWVQVNNAANAITIPAASRVHDATNNYKNTRSEMDETLKLVVNNDANGFSDRTIIGFRDDAEMTFDWDFDSHKLFGQPSAPQLWTLIDGEEFSTNNLPLVYESFTLPLNFKAGVTSTYHILAEGLESFYVNSEIYLEDIKTGNMIDLRTQPMYTYNGQPSDDNARFALHFFGVTSTSDIDDAEAVNIYGHNGTIFIKTESINQNYKIEIYDVMGRRLLSTNFTSTGLDTFIIDTDTGVYFVKLQSATSTQVEKINLR